MSFDLYAPAPVLRLAVSGHPAARAHAAAEYADAATDGDARRPDVAIDLTFGARGPHGAAEDGHKTVRWAVALDPPDATPLRARIALRGRPRSLALSLVQGFVIEPLVSLAAARAGLVLLPAAALAADGGATLVIGRSRSGKTSVVARAVAAGHPVLGDDRVLVDGAGTVRPWPRRLRVFPDLRKTAPAAVAALPTPARARLTALGALRVASRGWIAPPLPVAYADLGGAASPGPVPARRVVVVERGDAGDELATTPLGPDDVLRLAATVLEEQRRRLARLAGHSWTAALTRAAEREAVTLRAALAGLPAERWVVPGTWPAPRAVDALAARLGVADPGPRCPTRPGRRRPG